MKAWVRITGAMLAFSAAALFLAAALLAGGYYYVAPGLPDAEALRDVRIETPLSIYSRDGRLMAQFGESMRTPAAYHQLPPLVIAAFVAAEDEFFFEHPGVDYRGVARAAFNVLRTFGDRSIGGSTITQQVAKMHFLSPERLYVRKFKEWILALRIENALTKEEILELYLNTAFFGHRSYGVVTAARTYFGKELDELTVAEAALIAGIVQGPSILNPVSNPRRAAERRSYVLRRMRELDMISAEQHAAALATPVESHRHGRRVELDAPYVAEMVRLEMLRRYGPEALTAGLTVTTTIDSRLQSAANMAIRRTLLAYDERHGYRGAVARLEEERLELQEERLEETLVPAGDDDAAAVREHAERLLADYPDRAGTMTALVLAASPAEAALYVRGLGIETIGLDEVAWAAPYIDDWRVGPSPRDVTDVLRRGDIVRLRITDDGRLRLAQLPDVQGALVALDPLDGAVVALAGGFDFHLSHYNRAVQSRRQAGSSFKPFIYSAALEHGFTPATIINDAPLSLGGSELGTTWRPTNYSGRFYGDIRLREALVRSLNLASVRVLRDTGMDNTMRHLRGFGFDDSALPRDLTVALGAGSLSPLDLARGYAVFANGGFLVEPHFIERVEDARGNIVYQAAPLVACGQCPASEAAGDERALDVDGPSDNAPQQPLAPRAVSARNAYLMTDLLQDALRRGTGGRALALGREDVAGKTGTSNDEADAWFAGYNPDLVAVAWVGFDSPQRSLGGAAGAQESGSRTAFPMWGALMAEALAERPERVPAPPPGIVELRIDPRTGLMAGDHARETMFEKFYVERMPGRDIGGPFVEREPPPQRSDASPVSPRSIFY